jgi:hypothetical protein
VSREAARKQPESSREAARKRRRGEAHPADLRIKALSDVTVDNARDNEVLGLQMHTTPIEKERNMPRLEFGAVRATWRAALRRLDAWTLETLNAPAGGRRPQ